MALLLLIGALPSSAQTPENILLLVNDNSADSREIGRYYAQKRNIPETNICRIRTSESETVSPGVFESELLQPVAGHLKSRGLQDQVLYIVTTRGIPLVIKGDSGAAGGLVSVDSELSLLYRRMISGSSPFHAKVENPYFAVGSSGGAFRPFLRRDYDIYLVTRLAGSSAAGAARLVDRALAAGPGGGFYFDLASAQPTIEWEWVQQAASALKKAGHEVTVDQTGKVLDDLKAVQGYVRQYASDANPEEPIPNIQWNPGAVAAILSQGASGISPRPAPGKMAPNPWDVISRYAESGLTGFGGYMADPLPDGGIRPQILFSAYVTGHNLAESFHAASRYLGWRQVIVGDPLASPYARLSAAQRTAIAGEYQTAADAETGLPRYYSRRRQLHLAQKYPSSPAAVTLLLKAEAAAYRDRAGAMALLDRSLEENPSMAESHLLKGELLEAGADFAQSFEEYGKALESGMAGRDTYLKLARLAVDRIRDPRKAAPYAQWLYQRYGRTDPETAALYAEVQRLLDPPATLTPLSQETPPVPAAAAAPVQPVETVHPARVIDQPPIPYPSKARRSGVEGEVVVSFLLDEMGQLMKAEVVSGHRLLAEAVLEAAKRWRFQPRLENGRPVESRLTLPITFKLKKP